MRKSSRTVVLGSITAISAAILSGCASETTADCVDVTTQAPDGTYQTVPDEHCASGGTSPTAHRYVYYYGGTQTAPGRVGRGTTIKPADTWVSTRRGTVVQRGGFGFRGGSGGG